MVTKAFIRVSTVLQDTEKNKLDILQFANRMKLGQVDFIEEHCSGCKDYKKRKLGALLDTMGKDDVLIVPELSRIARSITQILEVIKITKDKGIILYSIKEGFDNTDNSITSTVTSTIFALVAQIERELISLRTREALQARKAQGVKLGRPQGKGKSKLDEHTDDIMRLINLGVPKTLIAKQYNTTIGNLYNFLNQLKESA